MYVFLLSSSIPAITVSIAKGILETLEDMYLFMQKLFETKVYGMMVKRTIKSLGQCDK